MTRTYHRTKDGQQVAEQDAFDERGQLRDGFSMRTPVLLRDGVPSAVIDEQRCAIRAKYEAQVTNAWRNPSLSTPALDARTRDAALASANDPYARYERKLQDAWRS